MRPTNLGPVLFILLFSCAHCRVFPPIRDWNKWIKCRGLLDKEIRDLRSKGPAPTEYDFVTDGIEAKALPSLEVSPSVYGANQIDFWQGRGYLLRGNADGFSLNRPTEVEVTLPNSPVNVCGVALRRPSNLDDGIKAIEIQWRTDTSMPYRPLTNLKTGNLIFETDLRSSKQTDVILVDSVPAKHFKMRIYSKPKHRPCLRLAFLHTCYYLNTVFMDQCGGSIMNDARFKTLPYGNPISIKCPIDCTLSRPCWGYEIYTEDSPICWAATQYFGHEGSGIYTLYKIKRAARFHQEVDPKKNHGINCERYDQPYKAYAFDKLSYDRAVAEQKRQFGV